MPHNSVTNHSRTGMRCNIILNETPIRAATDLRNNKIIRQEYIMQLNDLLAMTTLQTKFMDDYTDNGYEMLS